MDRTEAKKYYDSQQANFLRLGENLKSALASFLDEEKITYHSITYRIKDFESFFEKIERKKYSDPIEQIEDFCGLRVVCFYPLDLERIGNLINKEFLVKESIDRTTKFEPDRFGYRSNHYILFINESWENAPNYRGLKNLKAEVQVRTILMHAWADIEHKLAYKKKEQIPEQFRRKMYQLSALLEIADEQFQDLKNERESFKKSLIISKKGKSQFDFDKELSLDSLQAFLDYRFPDRHKNTHETSDLLEELFKYETSIKWLEERYQDLKPNMNQLEKKMVSEIGTWGQTGIIRVLMDIYNDDYFNNRSGSFKNGEWGKGVVEFRNKINQ